jgi:hypothetical protein
MYNRLNIFPQKKERQGEPKMKGRKKMNKRKSMKLFSKTADRTHKFNLQRPALFMRGGIRM